VIVDYDRWAFRYPVGNVRVTIDMDVRTAPYRYDIFDPRLLTIPVLDEGEAVLEVKYDDFLPDVIYRLIDSGHMRQTTFSKFYLGCKAIGGKINELP
jgi:hypothetical protein